MLPKSIRITNVQFAIHKMDGVWIKQLNNVHAVVIISWMHTMEVNAKNVKIYCQIVLNVHI